jgi:hypothetical protein
VQRLKKSKTAHNKTTNNKTTNNKTKSNMSEKVQKFILSTFGVLTMSILVSYLVFAWTEPSQSPPQGNVPAPLNVGPQGQAKEGGLILNTGGAPIGFIVQYGNVGIGTMAPGAKLDVVGDVRVQGWDAVYKSLDTGGGVNRAFHLIGTYHGWDAAAIYIPGYNYYNPEGGNVNRSYAQRIHFGRPERMTIDLGSGNVGIGTTAPAYKLDISGDVRWTGTLQGGSVPWQRLTNFPSSCPSGQFVTALGTNNLTCAAPSGGIGGSGTTNYIAKFTGQTTIGNSQIYDNGTNVGIGTTVPGAKLDVAGTIRAQDVFAAGGQNLIIGDDVFLTDIDTANTLGIYGLQNSTQAHIKLGSSGPVISGVSGNLGIGTTNPDPNHRLTVSGSMRSQGAYFEGNVAIGYSGTSYSLTVNGQNVCLANGTNCPTGGGLWAVSGNNIYNTNSGNVGIGTSDVTAKLTIQNLSDTQSSLLIKRSIPLFQKTLGGLSSDGARSIRRTSDGGYVIVGETYSFGAGNGDVFVIKLDSSGNLSWAKTIGGGNYDYGYSIQQTSDGGYVITGYTSSFGAGNGDVFVIKLDSSGNLSWAKTIGGGNYDFGVEIQQTLDLGYIITGGTSSFGAGGSDVFVIKLDSSGNFSWAKTIGGSGSDFSNSIQRTSDGGYVITGYTSSFGERNGDVFVIKLDSYGNVSWVKTIGYNGYEIGRSIRVTSDGGYVITGETYSLGAGGSDVFVIKLNSSGNLSWAKTIGGMSDDFGYSIQQTSDGGYVITGYTNSFGAASYDVFVIKLDYSGNLSWAARIGGGNSDFGYSIQQTSDGGYVITGMTNSFGAGGYDVFVIKFPGCNSGTTYVTPTVYNVQDLLFVLSPSPSVYFQYPTVGSPSPSVSSQSPTTASQCSATSDFIHFVVTSYGDVGIGGAVSIGTGALPPYNYKLDVGGAIHGTSFPVSSDVRFKTNLERLDNVLSKLNNISAYKFDWNELYQKLGRSDGRRHIGVIAQEIEKEFPELVSEWEQDGVKYKSVDYSRLTAVLLEAIKAQQKEIEELKLVINEYGILATNNGTTNGGQQTTSNETANNEQSIFDRFTLAIKKSLEKLGLIIENGIVKVKEIIAGKITTKQICLEGDDGEIICIDKNQLKQLLEQK